MSVMIWYGKQLHELSAAELDVAEVNVRWCVQNKSMASARAAYREDLEEIRLERERRAQ